LGDDKSRELAFELKNSKYENERLNEILQQRNAEVLQLRQLHAEAERKAATVGHLQEELQSYKTRFDAQSEQFNKADFELVRLRQTAGLKDGQLSELTAERDRSKARLATIEEQLDRERQDSRFRTNQLEQKLSELERRSKSTE